MKNEVWKSVVGYEGLYEISSLGRVKRLARVIVDSLGRTIPYKEKILVNSISKQTGYPYVNLSKDGNVKTQNIHRLIAEAFIPNPNNLPCVNHIDENRANSVLSNLEWCDYSYNNSYGSANKKRKDTLRKGLVGKHKTIYQFSIKGSLISVYDCGVKQLEEQLGYDIGDCLNGKSKTAHGFVFSYNCIFKYEEDSPASHQKYVILIDENGKELKRYKSVSVAAKENGFDRHLFSKTPVVDGIVTIRGLRFIVEQKENEYIPKGHKGPRPDLKGKCAKPVCQYTKSGDFVCEYPSIIDAKDAIGKPKGGPDISNCCNGKLKTAYGFIWRYKGEPAPAPFKNDVIRRIEQYSFDGELIATHESITDAIKSIGYGRPTCIGNNLAGRSHSAYGYVWKYAE